MWWLGAGNGEQRENTPPPPSEGSGARSAVQNLNGLHCQIWGFSIQIPRHNRTHKRTHVNELVCEGKHPEAVRADNSLQITSAEK